MGDTNVQANPNEVLNVLAVILRMLDKQLHGGEVNSDKAAEDEMKENFIQYARTLNKDDIAKGDTILIQPVKQRHFEDIKQYLVRQHIPFGVYPDGSGNHVIAICSQDREKFLDILSSVYNHSVDGQVDKTPENILNTYKHIGSKDAIVLRLKDEDMEQAALNSLLENNIVGVKIDVRIIVSSVAANFKDNGRDLDKVKLDIALYAATRNYIPPQFVKEWEASEVEQRAYDNKVISEAISELKASMEAKASQKVVLASPTDPFAPAVIMGISENGEIEASKLEYNSETNTFEETKLDIRLDDNEEDIRYFLSVQTMDIPRLCRMGFDEYENEIQGEKFTPEIAERIDSGRPEEKQNAGQISSFLNDIKSISDEINKKATELVNKIPIVAQMTAMEASVLKEKMIRKIFEENLKTASLGKIAAPEYRIEKFNEMNYGDPPLMQSFFEAYQEPGMIYKESVASLQKVIDNIKINEYEKAQTKAQTEEYTQGKEDTQGKDADGINME